MPIRAPLPDIDCEVEVGNRDLADEIVAVLAAAPESAFTIGEIQEQISETYPETAVSLVVQRLETEQVIRAVDSESETDTHWGLAGTPTAMAFSGATLWVNGEMREAQPVGGHQIRVWRDDMTAAGKHDQQGEGTSSGTVSVAEND